MKIKRMNIVLDGLSFIFYLGALGGVAVGLVVLLIQVISCLMGYPFIAQVYGVFKLIINLLGLVSYVHIYNQNLTLVKNKDKERGD